MHKFFLPLLLIFLSFSVQAQYTETINSNRPGNSQGAFAVGRDVVQLEVGPHYGQTKHKLTSINTNLFGIRYQVRYGTFSENFEINLSGDYVSANRHFTAGGVKHSYTVSNFKRNTLGVKYLLFDPHKNRYFEGPNLYSWKANHRPRWEMLIPAVSIYAGLNLTVGNRPSGYPFFGGATDKVSPKLALITQNNIGPFVFVMNFIADRITSQDKRYVGIFTLTHSLSPHLSAFVEYETIKDNFYADDLFRFGGAYLLNKNLQFDVAGLVNFKDTPSRWQVGIGASYRMDYHHTNERIYKTEPNAKKKVNKMDKKQNTKKKKGIF